MENHKQTEDRAAAWLARRDSGNWSENDQAHLTRWIEESIAHRVAFLRLEAAWEETRRLRALGSGRVPGIVPAPGEWQNTPFFDPRRHPQDTVADISTRIVAPQEVIEQEYGTALYESKAAGDDDARFGVLPVEGVNDLSAELRQGAPQVFTVEDRADSFPLEFPPKAAGSRSATETLRAQESPSGRTTRKARASGWRLFAMAVSLILAIGIGHYTVFSPVGDRYSTPIGGIASVPLEDGSNITLNTATKIRVDLSPNERRIDLQQGEAFFEVAKDAKRPFVVRVGDKRVVAVGTKFSVRRDENDIRIVVTEGTVRLESSNIAPSATKGVSGSKSAAGPGEGTGVRLHDGSSDSAMLKSTSLTAGTIALATVEDVLVDKASILKAEEILSWRQGYLSFHDMALADAVAEFNRYNSHTITIDDPKVAAIHISGTFRPTNYKAFVRLLRDGFSIHAKDDGDSIILTKD